MDSSEHLKTLLQVQLASDSSAVLNLPYVLESLNTRCFIPSAHLSKWTTRIHSLMCSKDPGSRWAGLCLAHKTSLYSQNIMIEFASSWIGIAMLAITKTQPLPTLKAAIRLLQLIFTSATNITEFQRQVSNPNITKFTSAVIGVAETFPNLEFKIYCMNILTNIIPMYPTAHRASYPALSKLSLRFLNGDTPSPTSQGLLSAASGLYTTLHLTGGKVGSSTLWRKTIDETLALGWTALRSVRTTFPNEARNRTEHGPPVHEDPAIAIPLGIDRLRSCVFILCDMLSAFTYRPIQVPIGSLVKFVTALLSCAVEDKVDGFVDSVVRSMEVSVVSSIWAYGCQLLSCVAQLTQHYLTPNLSQLVSIITFRLEQNPTSPQRVYFLNSLNDLIGNCLLLDSDLIPTRLVKALLPSLTVILASPPDEVSPDNTIQTNRKTKKRSRNFEGDEVFKLSRKVICESDADGKAILAALDVIQQLVQNPNLSPAMQSITGRVLLSIQLTISRMSPASFSPNLEIYKGVHQKVQAICIKLGSGTTSIMGKSLPLVIKSTLPDENPDAFDILLHPRMPPLVQPMPHTEHLSLFYTEESEEERGARDILNLGSLAEPSLSHDILMDDTSTRRPVPIELLPSGLNPKPTPEILTEYPLRQNSLPPKINDEPMRAVDILPMSEDKQISISPIIPSQVSKPQPPTSLAPFISIEGNEDDEEMPTIDLDSDSDEEL